jgi:hypothetical protein
MPEDHIAAVESEVGCARYRPEEVVAAGIIWPPAARFDAAKNAAKEVIAVIRTK